MSAFALDPSMMALLMGGQAIGGLAGLMQGASTNRAARQARDRYAQETSTAGNRLGSMVYGGDLWDSVWRSGIAGPDQQKYADQYAAGIGGPLYKQMQDLIGAAGSTKALDTFNADASALQGGNQAAMLQALGAHDAGSADLWRMFSGGANAGLGAYDQGAAGLTKMLERSGVDRGRIIRQDAAKQLRQTNDASLAALQAGGLGNSTLRANSIAGNARSVGEQQDRALTDLNDMVTNQKVGLGRSLLSERSGLQKGYFDQSAAALTDRANSRDATYQDFLKQALNYQFANMGTRAGLTQGQEDRVSGAKQNYINFLNSIQSGGVMNPWLGQNTSQYYPGASGAASALNSFGSGMNDIAGLLIASKMFGGK